MPIRVSEELFNACNNGDIASVKMCLAARSDVNRVVGGATALIAACWRNHTEIVRLLLCEENIDIGVTSILGRTALDVARCWGHTEIVTMLEEYSRSPGSRDKASSNTPAVPLSPASSSLSPSAPTNSVEPHSGRASVDPLGDHLVGLESILKALSLREVSQVEEKRKIRKSYRVEKEAMEERQMVERQDMEQRLNLLEEGHNRECRELLKEKEAVKSRIRELLKEDSSAKAPECPVCYERMYPPKQIFYCSNGHHVCGDCRPRLEQCYCRMRFVGRAISFEAFLRDFQ